MGKRRTRGRKDPNVTENMISEESIRKETEKWIEMIACEGLAKTLVYGVNNGVNKRDSISKDRFLETVALIKNMSREKEVLQINPDLDGSFGEDGSWAISPWRGKWIFVYSTEYCDPSIPIIEAARRERLQGRIGLSGSQRHLQYNTITPRRRRRR